MTFVGGCFLTGSLLGTVSYAFLGIRFVHTLVGTFFGSIALLFFLYILLFAEKHYVSGERFISRTILLITLIFQCLSFTYIIKDGGLWVGAALFMLATFSSVILIIITDFSRWEKLWEIMQISQITVVFFTAPLFFCFPIVGRFTTDALLLFFPWQVVLLFWATLMGSSTVLWLIGQQRDREARNPLHGILDSKTASKIVSYS